MNVQTAPKLIEEFLTRGVKEIFPSKAFVKKRLEEGERLTVYLGIDPTGPTLHLGHVIPLRKLQQLQGLGHRVVLLIGDFTGMIGDPMDKSAARKRLTRKEVLENARAYQKQAGKFLKFSGSNPAEIKYNSRWLAKMTFEEVIELCARATVSQMLARDMFKRRQREGREIFLHEFIYPLMQGYDSVVMDVDGEVGGNDQMFNMLVGRTLMKEMKGKEKFVMTMKLLADPSGRKMGKTEGNMITFDDSADEMLGKVMSWTDGMILGGFEFFTDAVLKEIKDALKKENPRDVKMRLAEEVVSIFYGVKAAKQARERFVAIFQRHERPGTSPGDVPVLKITGTMTLMEVLVTSGLTSSKSEARRLINEGGVKIDGVVIKDYVYPIKAGSLLQKGKRHFLRLV